MSEGDETVDQHQQVDESGAGLADNPYEEDIDGEYGGGGDGKEGAEIAVERKVDLLGVNDLHDEELLARLDREGLDLSHVVHEIGERLGERRSLFYTIESRERRMKYFDILTRTLKYRLSHTKYLSQ